MDSDDLSEPFEVIDNLLIGNNLPFCFDITVGEGCPLLIFSPEGDPSEAIKIDELLRDAPSCGSWRFFGRRQKKDLDDAAAIVMQLYPLDPRLMKYGLMRSASRWLLTMQIPADSDITPDEAQGMVALSGISSLDERIKIRIASVDRIGEDLRILARTA